MTLFLDGIFNTDGISEKLPPSAIRVYFPVAQRGGANTAYYSTIQGLLTNEVTVSSQIKWGTILSDLSSLQSVAALLGDKKMWTWIGASTLCWQGNEPIKTNFDFYLINYKRGLKLEEKLKDLNMLAALIESNDVAKVLVHGGYKSNVLVQNTYLLNNGQGGKQKGTKEPSDEEGSTLAASFTNFLSDLLPGSKSGSINSEELEQGTVRVVIGNKLHLSQMLLQRLDVTPSIVEVEGGLPLYYRVSMSLTGTRPLVSGIVDEMYAKGV